MLLVDCAGSGRRRLRRLQLLHKLLYPHHLVRALRHIGDVGRPSAGVLSTREAGRHAANAVTDLPAGPATALQLRQHLLDPLHQVATTHGAAGRPTGHAATP